VDTKYLAGWQYKEVFFIFSVAPKGRESVRKGKKMKNEKGNERRKEEKMMENEKEGEDTGDFLGRRE
jgi:hypothetical protein